MNTNKKRRVCIIMGGHFAATIGGAQYQAKCIVDQLVGKDEFEIFYLARSIDPDFKPKGYEIRQISSPNRIRRHGFFFDTVCLNRLLKEIKPDVIYQRGLKAYTGIAAYYARKNASKLIFHIAHDYDVIPQHSKNLSWHSALDFTEKKFGEYGLRRADYIVAQSHWQSDLLKRNYDRSTTMVLPNLHPTPGEVIKKESVPVRVVWVANFKPMKRPEMFVQLAEDLHALRNVEFLMIGRPGDPKRYRELHKRICNIRNLRYLGECSIEEVNNALAKAHIFVNTSIAEGFPNTFIQAWMRKVPVVSASINVDGVFDDASIGLYGKTYEGLKEAVINLIENEDTRRGMGDCAQAYAFMHHSINNVEKLITLMRE